MDDLTEFRVGVNDSMDLNSIANRCVAILKEEIQRLVYGSYNPVVYTRTYQLIESVKFEIDSNGSISIQWDVLSYSSVLDGSSQGDNVISWVNFGHKDDTAIDNMYHNYPGRHFLESASIKMSKELGVTVKVVENGIVVFEVGEENENWVLV